MDYDECLKVIRVFDCTNLLEIYDKFKDYLSSDVRKYFDGNNYIIQEGIITVGKLEKYFNLFGKKVLSTIHSKKIRAELLEKKTREERIEFYDKKWNNFRWRLLFKIFFSKTVMGKIGRGKAFFRYFKVNVGENILPKTKYAITELYTSENSYLQYIKNG